MMHQPADSHQPAPRRCRRKTWIDTAMVADYGTSAARVHALLRAGDTGAGVWITNGRIAQECDVNPRSVQRAISKLVQAGLVQRRIGQRANHYEVVAVVSATTNVVAERFTVGNDVEDSGESESKEHEQSEFLNPDPLSHIALPRRSHLAIRQQLPRNSPFYRHRDTDALLECFESMVRQRHLTETGKTRAISGARRLGWSASANTLLDTHTLDELTTLLGHIFTRWGGYLPFPVISLWTGFPDPRERKVTRLGQILENYNQITRWMADEDPQSPWVPVTEKTSVDYDNGVDFEQEEKVTELVRLFSEFRMVEPTDFQRHNWAKTFRIMLAFDHRSADDIRTVITNVRPMQRWIDINRYHAPIRIRQDWDVLHPQVVGLADALKARQETIADMKRRAAEHPRWDDHWPSSTAYADDADGVGSVDMSTNVAERQRRYDRRACQTRRKAG